MSRVVYRKRSSGVALKDLPPLKADASVEAAKGFWDSHPRAQRVVVVVVFLMLSAGVEYATRKDGRVEPSVVEAYVPRNVFKYAILTWVCVCMFNASLDNAYPYTLAYAVPLILMYYAHLGNYYMVLVQVFGVIPVMELFSGEDHENPDEGQVADLSKRMSFRYITWIWVPLQMGVIVWGLFAARAWALEGCDLAALTISIGVTTGGLGINIAHELIHKPTKLEKFLGRALLASVWYGHFYVEHLWGHHKMVSTPDDPASARYNESFYAFYPRSVVGSFTSAWRIALERCDRARVARYSPLHNEVISLLCVSAAMTAAVYAAFGSLGLTLFLGQSWTAFSLLELVNYIEHANLQREQRPDGSYEPVSPFHSWNASARITDRFLFRLQRHSDHHANAGRRYQILRDFVQAPQMPTGYAGMLVLALIPPLWFAIINPRSAVYKARLGLADAAFDGLGLDLGTDADPFADPFADPTRTSDPHTHSSDDMSSSDSCST